MTCNGDDTKGWISRAPLEDGHPSGELRPFIATKPELEVDAPVGITVGPDGDLWVSQMGEMTIPEDSLLTVYDPDSGELKASYETGLSDIAGLAFSPKTGALYAVDFAWHDTTQGGLFELTIDGDEVTARKVLDLDKPSALAFDARGNLFVTVFGTAEEGADGFPGQVVRVPAPLLTADAAGANVPAVLNFKMASLEGKEVDLGDYSGNVVLVVNVASRCGATPQYEPLQGLYEKYKDGRARRARLPMQPVRPAGTRVR